MVQAQQAIDLFHARGKLMIGTLLKLCSSRQMSRPSHPEASGGLAGLDRGNRFAAAALDAPLANVNASTLRYI
ncbi:hypothetical protein [Dyella sp.]|uniref:hypothetical protein n=1 Tax=Dyella sp. TaxID=1869338 RepID=UPI002D78E5B2|nr:hypothetical protein [Dyella sp.]HET7333233.1 hypothetical protein [Dyella sp.]